MRWVRMLGMVGALVGLLLGVGASSATGSGNGRGDSEFQRFVRLNWEIVTALAGAR